MDIGLSILGLELRVKVLEFVFLFWSPRMWGAV